jgi:hypothetical protein
MPLGVECGYLANVFVETLKSVFGHFFRHIIAVIHFNNNLNRAAKTRKSDEAERLQITYPKFKNGEATIRNVKVAQNFCK